MLAKAELEEFLQYITFELFFFQNIRVQKQSMNLFFQILDTMQNDVLTNAWLTFSKMDQDPRKQK